MITLVYLEHAASQKAPSTRRCIKTAAFSAFSRIDSVSRKAPSTRRCIKTITARYINDGSRSESTQHQKAY